MEPNEYILSDDEQGLMDGIAAAIKGLQDEATVILRSIARARKLDGNWQYNAETKKFTRS